MINYRVKRNLKIIALVFLGLALIYFIGHGFSLWSKKPPPALPPVSIAPVQSKPQLVETVDAIGTVVPVNTVTITPQVDGQLEKINFKPGDTVSAGQVLFQIDPRTYAAKLTQAQATLEHDIAQQKSTDLLLKRYTALSKKGYVSKQDFDQAKANADSLAASVTADQAAVTEAKLDLDHCTIRAPITGKTGDWLISAGNIVSATNHTPLVVINQIAPIDINFTLPEKYLAQLQQNTPIDINQSLKAPLVFINNNIDNTTGTIQLKARFANENKALWPGQFVRVRIPVAYFSNALVVPFEALQYGQDGAYVYKVIQNKAYYQPVTAGPQTSQGVIIFKGLQNGDKVVTAGQLKISDGREVSIEP